jgi:ATP-binding cassette subfamily F protein 3
MIAVSHDRYFLDSVTKRTWEVASGALETYRSPYTGYVVEKERRRKEQMRVWESQQDYIERTREFIRIHIAGQRSREARGRRTRLERFLRDEAVDRPPEEDSISVSLEPKRHTGDQVLIAEGLEAGYDPASPLLASERLEVFSGDRIAVLGPNGIGKTTLLRTLLGDLPPLSGTVRRGSNVDIGYLSQTHGELDPDQTALEAVLGAARGAREQAARDILGGLLLSGDDAFKRTGDLSGGERSRVLLAQLAVQSANVLVLDEPTNHLDMPSTEIMQGLLAGFAGTIIFVSHDRYLIRAVANRVWAFDDGRVRVIHGGWDHYVEWREKKSARPSTEKEQPSADSERSRFERRRREARQLEKLRRRQEELEAEIERTEKELSALTDEISAWGRSGDVDRVRRLSESFAEKKGTLENLWREWESLGEELL